MTDLAGDRAMWAVGRGRGEGLGSVVTGISMPTFFESDVLVDDGDGVLVHLRRHGSYEAPQQFCDASLPGLSSWRAGRQAWAGAQHRKYNGGPCYTEGGLYEHRRGVIPPELLEIVDGLPWSPELVGGDNDMHIGDRFGERQRLVPHLERMLLDTVDQQLTTAPFGFTIDPASNIVYLTHRRPGGEAGARDYDVHRDSAYDPWRRWLTVVLYFTAPADYEGGDLVIAATGERLRPGRGDVVLIRGDVEHQVEPLTAGSRTTMTAHAAERRWWIDPADDLERVSPGERCLLVDRLFRAGGLVDVSALRRAVALAWCVSAYPEHWVPGDRWVKMFRAAGFIADRAENQPPTEALEVFRACDPGDERRLTWTPVVATARWFQCQYGRAELWRAVVPPAAVLARFGYDNAIEVVVDPGRLEQLERV